MIKAFLRVNCEPENIVKIGPALADLHGVAEVYTTTGSVDYIALIRVADVAELAVLITEGVATIPGIRRTDTHVAIRSYGRGDDQVAFDIGVD
jgi:DNA-binding Lrp family transcriptional regulator